MVRKILFVSTGHLSLKTVDWLDAVDWKNDPKAPWGAHVDQGFFTIAHPLYEATGLELPSDLAFVMQRAREHLCDYIHFDCDAPFVDWLPRFHHERKA